MSKRAVLCLFVAFLAVAHLSAESDPFLGKWKLNPSRSRFVDEIRVEPLSADKCRFIFTGSPGETVVMDGTDQPGIAGTTISVTAEDSHTWKVVRKQAGRTLLTATWKLSEDGRTLHDSFTSFQPDGSSSTVDLPYQRVAAGTGFAGTWESNTPQFDSTYEIQVQPYDTGGLTFITPSLHRTKNLKFDGNDHANPGVAPNYTSSARRTSTRALEVTDKMRGELYDTQEISVSPDGKSLTVTMHPIGQTNPTVLVFEKQ